MSADLNKLKQKLVSDSSLKNEEIGFYNSALQKCRKALKYRFFLIVNIFLLITVLFFSLSVRAVQAQQKVQIASSEWVDIAKTFLEMSDNDKQKSISQIESEIKAIIKPVGQFTGTQDLLNDQIDSANDLMQEWLNTLQPLLAYRLSLDGLVSVKSSNDYFTNDLEKVFESIPTLLQKTKDKWNSFAVIRFILGNFGTAKIKLILQSIDDSLVWADKIYTYREQVLQILGHNTRQRFLIFNQNIGEARPTGGFIGSYIPIELFKGRLTIGKSQSIYNVDDAKLTPLLTHPANWYYAIDYKGAGESGIRNINYFPCFPTTAAALKREFATSPKGFSSDAIVFLNPQFLQSLWPNDLFINIEPVGEINKFNFLEQVEKLTSPSLLAKDDKNPKAEITPIAEAFISNFSKVITAQSSSKIIATVGLSLLKRDLQIWFDNGDIQNLWEDTDLAGRQTCNNKSEIPTVSFLLANISSDKRSLVTNNQFNIYSENTLGGRTVHFGYTQIIPDKPDLLREFNSETPLSFVGLQIPKNATRLTVSGDQVLQFPGLRENFISDLVRQGKGDMKLLAEAKTVQDSMSDLDKGFAYFQPDGSQVVGAYIRDEKVSKLEFSFFLPDSAGAINFYPQPGMVNTDLSLGDGATFNEFPDIKYINNPDSIAIGKTILFR